MQTDKDLERERKERRRIKSKVLQYDDVLLDKLDTLIGNKKGSVSCLKEISLGDEKKLSPPSMGAMDKYIKKRREQLDIITVDRALDNQRKLSNLPPLPDLRLVTSWRDKRATLAAILDNYASRIEIIKEIQEGEGSERYESILIDALGSMTETIEKQSELDKDLGFDHSRLQAVVSVLLKHISSTVSQAYKDVHGDEKIESFVKALDKRLDSLPFDVIQDEVMSVVTETTIIGAAK